MTKLNQNVKNYVSGDSLDIGVTALDADGAALDITGATITYAISPADEPGGTAVVTKSTADGITITDAAAGTFTITIDAGDTAALETADYHHEVQVTTADSKVYTILRGKISALADQITT
jgi:hypothetical protein